MLDNSTMERPFLSIPGHCHSHSSSGSSLRGSLCDTINLLIQYLSRTENAKFYP